MKLTVYHLKTCDTCRKAIKALKAADHALTLIDVRADGVSERSLTEITAVVGWHKALNTRSTTWRGLQPSEKEDMDQTKAIALMMEHPTLLKRPVIDTGDGITVGWTADVQAQYI